MIRICDRRCLMPSRLTATSFERRLCWRLAKSIDLSHPLVDGLLTFPGDPVFSIKPHTSTPKDQYNVSQVSMGTHSGTHLDAMFHFVPSGKTIDQMPLEWFYGPARVLRIPKKPREEITAEDFKPYEALLTPGARIIYDVWLVPAIRPGEILRGFSLADPGCRALSRLAQDLRTPAAHTLTRREYYEVHHILLGVEIVVVEGLNHLDQVPDEFIFVGFPLLLPRIRDGLLHPRRRAGAVAVTSSKIKTVRSAAWSPSCPTARSARPPFRRATRRCSSRCRSRRGFPPRP